MTNNIAILCNSHNLQVFKDESHPDQGSAPGYARWAVTLAPLDSPGFCEFLRKPGRYAKPDFEMVPEIAPRLYLLNSFQMVWRLGAQKFFAFLGNVGPRPGIIGSMQSLAVLLQPFWLVYPIWKPNTSIYAAKVMPMLWGPKPFEEMYEGALRPNELRVSHHESLEGCRALQIRGKRTKKAKVKNR